MNPGATIDELIAAARSSGKLSYVDPTFQNYLFPETSVRSTLVLAQLPPANQDYYTSEVTALLRAQGLLPATVYELVAYALEGWDGTTSVIAMGSTNYYALVNHSGTRGMVRASRPWSHQLRYLTVVA